MGPGSAQAPPHRPPPGTGGRGHTPLGGVVPEPAVGPGGWPSAEGAANSSKASHSAEVRVSGRSGRGAGGDHPRRSGPRAARPPTPSRSETPTRAPIRSSRLGGPDRGALLRWPPTVRGPEPEPDRDELVTLDLVEADADLLVAPVPRERGEPPAPLPGRLGSGRLRRGVIGSGPHRGRLKAGRDRATLETNHTASRARCPILMTFSFLTVESARRMKEARSSGPGWGPIEDFFAGVRGGRSAGSLPRWGRSGAPGPGVVG